jgi:hypothetical protein
MNESDGALAVQRFLFSPVTFVGTWLLLLVDAAEVSERCAPLASLGGVFLLPYFSVSLFASAYVAYRVAAWVATGRWTRPEKARG